MLAMIIKALVDYVLPRSFSKVCCMRSIIETSLRESSDKTSEANCGARRQVSGSKKRRQADVSITCSRHYSAIYD